MRIGYVYLIGNDMFGWYKIGKSIHPDIRVKDIGVLLPFSIQVKAVWESQWYSELESKLHRDWADCRTHGEWFKFSRQQIKKLIQSRPEKRIEIEAPFQLKEDCPEGKILVVQAKGNPAPKYRIQSLISALSKNTHPKKQKLFGYLLHEICKYNSIP